MSPLQRREDHNSDKAHMNPSLCDSHVDLSGFITSSLLFQQFGDSFGPCWCVSGRNFLPYVFFIDETTHACRVALRDAADRRVRGLFACFLCCVCVTNNER